MRSIDVANGRLSIPWEIQIDVGEFGLVAAALDTLYTHMIGGDARAALTREAEGQIAETLPDDKAFFGLLALTGNLAVVLRSADGSEGESKPVRILGEPGAVALARAQLRRALEEKGGRHARQLLDQFEKPSEPLALRDYENFAALADRSGQFETYTFTSDGNLLP